MKNFAACLFLIVVALTQACVEPSTTIEIQNYDGPIYLHIPSQGDEDTTLHHKCPHHHQHHQHQQTVEIECTCIAKPSVKCIPINTASEYSCNNIYNTGTFPGPWNSGTCNSGACNGYPSSYNGGYTSNYPKGIEKVYYTVDSTNMYADSNQNGCKCHKCSSCY